MVSYQSKQKDTLRASYFSHASSYRENVASARRVTKRWTFQLLFALKLGYTYVIVAALNKLFNSNLPGMRSEVNLFSCFRVVVLKNTVYGLNESLAY